MLELFERYKIKKPIRLIELFAGYGSQALALSNLGVEFEHYKVVEFDKYAIQSYNALHNTNFETIDITKFNNLDIVDKDKYEYVMTYSFPCTDLSMAGKQSGMSKGGTSGSSLLWEVERLLKESEELPQVLLMENVTQIHGTKFKNDFNEWIAFLSNLGYSNQWKDMNAKDYGVAQNRDRTFMVSILGDYEYHFPQPFDLELKLKDYLEEQVDEKYYISDKLVTLFNKTVGDYDRSKVFEPYDKNEKEYAKTITTRSGSRPTDNFIKEDNLTKMGSYYTWPDNQGNINTQCNRASKGESVSLTVATNNTPKVIINKEIIYEEPLERDGWHNKAKEVLNTNGITTCIHTQSNNLLQKIKEEKSLRIRKLTPRECFRLMGLKDNQVNMIFSTGMSNTQLYKQAGNSIVVNVLEEIFKELIE